MKKIYVVSAFSKNGQGGNKAGVVLNCAELSREEKMKIAADLGYSETAFVLSSQEADYEVQYFTPTEEVPVCGHATIATFSLLHQLELLEKQACTIQTKAGILKIEVKEDGMIMMQQNCPKYLEVLDEQEFADCLEISYKEEKYPIQIVTTGLKDIIFPVDSLEHLAELQPDFPVMAEVNKRQDVVGMHAFTLVDEEGIDAICRNFAPLVGIDEESATGTASCALASYLFKYWKKKKQYVFEQGYSLGAPSRIVVNISYHGDEIEEIHVGGYGYFV